MDREKNISINGEELVSKGKKKYSWNDEEYTLKGNTIFGVNLFKQDKEIVIINKLTPLEWVLVCVPLALVFIGGAIGGFLGFLSAYINAIICRSNDEVAPKIGLSILSAFGAVILWYVLAVIILSL